MSKILVLFIAITGLLFGAIAFSPLTKSMAQSDGELNKEEKIMTDAKKETKEFSTDHLTPLQKKVTMEGATERAFDNEYWDHKEEGIYVDVINGEPLFSSTDKFDSRTGWPSFTKPISENMVDEHKDTKFGMTRTEVKSTETNAHLGHVFNDGPAEAGGLRYCINSASMRFVPKADLEAEGYGQYLKLFTK